MERIKPKQRKALESLMTSGDISQAAQAAGVSRDTLYRWMRDPLFKTALEESTKQALISLSRLLVVLGERAGETLQTAMADPTVPIGVSVRAADIVLSRLLQLRELADLESRVSELERINHDKTTA